MTIYERAIETYGKDMQLTVAVEELSELIKEICKNKRGEDNIDHITEELADCYIMMDQIALILGIKHCDITAVIDEKLARLERRLKMEHCDPVGDKGECGLSKKCQADTLSDFKNRLTRAIGTYTNESYVYVYAWFKLIDQIAEEIIKGETK